MASESMDRNQNQPEHTWQRRYLSRWTGPLITNHVHFNRNCALRSSFPLKNYQSSSTQTRTRTIWICNSPVRFGMDGHCCCRVLLKVRFPKRQKKHRDGPEPEQTNSGKVPVHCRFGGTSDCYDGSEERRENAPKLPMETEPSLWGGGESISGREEETDRMFTNLTFTIKDWC